MVPGFLPSCFATSAADRSATESGVGDESARRRERSHRTGTSASSGNSASSFSSSLMTPPHSALEHGRHHAHGAAVARRVAPRAGLRRCRLLACAGGRGSSVLLAAGCRQAMARSLGWLCLAGCHVAAPEVTKDRPANDGRTSDAFRSGGTVDPLALRSVHLCSNEDVPVLSLSSCAHAFVLSHPAKTKGPSGSPVLRLRRARLSPLLSQELWLREPAVLF